MELAPVIQEFATVGESPVDRTLRLMRKSTKRAERRDDGPLMGIGQIKQMLGEKNGEAVRGWLIKLVARGEVEAVQCINGLYWCVRREPPKRSKQDVADGHFILQRELMDKDRRTTAWFDAETFTNSERAQAALKYAQRCEECSAAEYNPRRPQQRIRLVTLPSLDQRS